ncbi:MAG: [FeFe] hydrogenase, group A [Planctomycetaceae bacterium]|nr:[FeFe] hydrogenase, group A [Planctomycetaceae bacterium]
MKNENQTTRREMLKTAALGTGLFLCGEQICTAQGGFQAGFNPPGMRMPLPIAANNPSIKHHQNRCRFCGNCREFCRNTTTVFNQPVPQGEEGCIYCGQCTHVCKRLALTEQFHYPQVAKAIADPDKIVIASTSPAIRVALGEMFRLAPGTNVEGKIVGALKTLGVNHVLDTTFSADLAVMEETAELLRRLEQNGTKKPLPMFTSCCPAWVRFARLFYLNLLPNISTVKSPVMMQGALVKTRFAQNRGIDPGKIVHVALTPCTAKKAEIRLPDMNAAGISHGKPEMRDVDVALTCRELAYLLNDTKVNFTLMQNAPYDTLMGTGSGAGMIFGNTGGVMEAVLRTAYKLLNDKNPPADFFDFRPVRGFDSVRQTSVDLGTRKLDVAVVHGIGKARPLLESLQSGTQKFDFVEVMACPGGCIGGGGQPVDFRTDATQLRQLRAAALYQHDARQEVRLSCDNPEIKAIYDEFLGEPLGERSEQLLHVAGR